MQPAFRRGRLPRKENAWSRHQHLFKENIRKTKIKDKKVESLCILKMRVRELFTHGEGISIPCTRHKGRQPLIKCANHDFKVYVFSLLCLCFFLAFLCFLLFCNPFCIFYLFVVNKGVSLAPTYSSIVLWFGAV